MSLTDVIALAEAYTGGAAVPAPTEIVGEASQRFTAGMPIICDIDRAGTTGALGVWGANLKNKYLEDDAALFQGDGSTTVFTCDGDTDGPQIDYTAFDNNNWIVRVGGTVIENGAGGGKFVVADDGSGNAEVTFGTAPADGEEIEIQFVTPVAVVTASTARAKQVEVAAYDFMWASAPAASSSSNVYLKPLTP